MFKNIIKAAVLLVVALFFIGLALGGPANARAFITGADIENGSIMYKDLNRGDVRLKIDGNTRNVALLQDQVKELQAQLDAGQ